MKYLVTVILLVCVLFCLTGCRLNYMEPEEVDAYLDGVAEKIGDSQITEDDELIGQRDLSDDSYCGSYIADCNNQTGRDVIFGSASTEERTLYVSGTVQTDSGSATVRIRLNDEVIELTPDENGDFETELSLESGGNYMMVLYEDFTGLVELRSAYDTNDSNKI